jgi:hypothetical protein
MVGDGLDQSFVDIYKLPGNEYCRNVIEIRGIYPSDVRQLRKVSRCSVFAVALLRRVGISHRYSRRIDRNSNIDR